MTITKRGNAEVLAGSQMRYDITAANTSNVPLESFFWYDRIPTDAARATVLTTGTYSTGSITAFSIRPTTAVTGCWPPTSDQQRLFLRPSTPSPCRPVR